MAITFPSNPTLYQTYTYNNKVWTFNGVRWVTTVIENTPSNTPIVPITVSDSVPGATTEGSLWVDSNTGTLSVYIGGSWVLASAGVLNTSANTLPGNAIVDSSITATKLAPGAAVPVQTGQTGKYLTTDGNNASWGTVQTLTVTDEGTTLSSNVASINFTGTNVTASNVGNAITVAVSGTSNLAIRAQAMTMGIIFGG